MSFIWMPSVELFECGLKFGGKGRDLEPSSIQAGSGEQFKRKKSISVGRALFHKQVFVESSKHGARSYWTEMFRNRNFGEFLEQTTV